MVWVVRLAIIFRLENLGRRLEPKKPEKDEAQTNLFDTFEFENETNKVVEEEEESEWVQKLPQQKAYLSI